MINGEDLTAVVQGPLPEDYDIRYSADQLRKNFPGAAVVLATPVEVGCLGAIEAAFDRVLYYEDAGALPSLKYLDPKPNSANRQLAASREALELVTTPLAMRLRSDATLMSPRVLEFWEQTLPLTNRPRGVGRGRIIASSIFTINPRFDERMAYHVSDMFQFGYTADLQRYFSAPPIPFETATWYERNRCAPGTLPKEATFRCRYAVEQWICLSYLFGADFPIAFHNDIQEGTIAEFEEHLVDNFVVAHPLDIGLRMPRFQHAVEGAYYTALCYSFNDWAELARQLRGQSAAIETEVRWPSTLEHKQKVVKRLSSPLIRAVASRIPSRLRKALASR